MLHHDHAASASSRTPRTISADRARPGDVVILSGPIAEHGMAIMAARAGLELETPSRATRRRCTELVRDMLATGADDPLPARSDARRRGDRAERARAPVGRRHRARRGGLRRPRTRARRVRAARPRPALRGQRGQAAGRRAARPTPVGCSTRCAGILKGARRASSGRSWKINARLVVLKTTVGGRRIVDMLQGEQLRKNLLGAEDHGHSRGARRHQGWATADRGDAARDERGRLPLGPLKTIHVYWLAGMSCDGCTISVAGATNPGIEGLLAGASRRCPR